MQVCTKTYVNARPYLWPHDQTLRPETTALVIVDMQNDFCLPGGYLDQQGYSIENTRKPIRNILSLLFPFRVYGFPIFFTREGHRPDLSDLTPRELARSRNNPSGLGIGDRGPLGRFLIRGEEGHEIIPELHWRKDVEPVIDKPGKSAFTYTDFELLLRVKEVKNLVIVGVTTDVCVSGTMREANDRGFDCLLVKDACGAGVERLGEAAAETVETEGGIFGATCTTNELLEAMERYVQTRPHRGPRSTDTFGA